MGNTPFREMLHQRFDAECTDRMSRDTLLYIIAAAEEREQIEKVNDYLRSHPEATIYDTLDYIDILVPLQLIEIVDDDDLYEEWAADCGL